MQVTLPSNYPGTVKPNQMQISTCKTCGEQIKLHGELWIHVGRSPCHPAIPGKIREINQLDSAVPYKPAPAMAPAAISPEQMIQSLTPREIEILGHIAAGSPNKAIAKDLCISPKTVEKHRQQIYNKSHIHCAIRLAHFCLAYGLIPNLYSIPPAIENAA